MYKTGNNKEWIPSVDELDTLFLAIMKNKLSLPRFISKQLSNPVSLLEKYKNEIGYNSFNSGLTEVLIQTCSSGQLQVVTHLLEYHHDQFDVNRLLKYRFKDRFITRKVGDKVYSQTLTVPSLLQKNIICVISRTNTLLHIAAHNNHFDIVKHLLKKGALVDPVNCCGQTPLMLGVHSLLIVKSLLDAGANLNHQDKMGYTPLLVATDVRASTDVISLLLQKGADYRVSDKCGYSFLHHVFGCNELVVDYSSILFKFNILPTCGETGVLLSNDVPLCLTSVEPNLLENMDENPLLSKDVQLSLKYLKPALGMILQAHYDPAEYRKALVHALNFKEKHKISFTYQPVEEAYRFQTETQLYPPTNSIDLIYQNLITVERVAGFGSYIPIWLILDACSILQTDDKLKKFYLLDRVADMLCYRVKHCPMDKKNAVLINQFIDIVKRFLRGTNPPKKAIKLVYKIISSAKIHLKNFQKIHGHQKGILTSQFKYRYADFRGDTSNVLICVLDLFRSLQLNNRIKEIISEFFRDCPTFVVNAYDEIYTPLHVAVNKYQDLLSLLLKCGADQWIHTRGYNGDFPIFNILDRSSDRKALLSSEAATVKLLLDYGMHMDSVNSIGVTLNAALIEVQYYKKPPIDRPISSLSCIAANAIVAGHIQYWNAPLPPRIKQFISWHDRHDFKNRILSEIIN